MKKHFKPRKPQRVSAVFILKNKSCCLFADPGTGKTGATLYTYSILKMIRPKYKMLVIAPLPAIMNTWQEEISEWDMFSNFTFKVLHGDEKQVKLFEKADIYLLNAENIKWCFNTILALFKKFPFHMLVLDESTLFKNYQAKRFKVIDDYINLFDRVLLLSGTPCPNSVVDLYSQMLLVDRGKTLGNKITLFREQYQKPHYKCKHVWIDKPNAFDDVQKKIAPYVLRLDRTDYFDMPDMLHNVVPIHLPKNTMKLYKQMEEKFFIELGDEVVFSKNSVTNYNVLRQIANGCLYDQSEEAMLDKANRVTFKIHDEKIKQLKIITSELKGKQALIAYQFKFQVEQINKALKGACIIGSHSKTEDLKKAKKNFLSGKLTYLAAHPQSVSHSLNLQHGDARHIIWLAISDSTERVQQYNERIYRPSVSSDVTAHYLVARETIEEAIYRRVSSKGKRQRSLLSYLRAYGKKKGYL